MKKRPSQLDNFLRDCERVNRLGQLFQDQPAPAPRPRKTEVLQEVSPGVFASVETPDPAPSVFGRLREQLEGLGRADDLAVELGRKIRRQVR